MNYIRVQWLHAFPNEPVWIICELDDSRLETRKIEIFPNGSKGYATKDEEVGGTLVGLEPVPPLDEIAAYPQFLTEEITEQEFEEVWRARGSRS